MGVRAAVYPKPYHICPVSVWAGFRFKGNDPYTPAMYLVIKEGETKTKKAVREEIFVEA
jgi:hypothetical protein